MPCFSPACFCMGWVDHNIVDLLDLWRRHVSGKGAQILFPILSHGVRAQWFMSLDWREACSWVPWLTRRLFWSRRIQRITGSPTTAGLCGSRVAGMLQLCWEDTRCPPVMQKKPKGHHAVFSFSRERAFDEFLTCPASCFPKCWELPVASGLAGASSVFLVFPSVKRGCYWGHRKDWLDRSVSWSHFSQWLQWDAQPRTMAGYTTLNISAVLWKMKSSDFSTYVSGGAEKLFMMFTADTADIIHENMGNGALFLYRDNL